MRRRKHAPLSAAGVSSKAKGAMIIDKSYGGSSSGSRGASKVAFPGLLRDRVGFDVVFVVFEDEELIGCHHILWLLVDACPYALKDSIKKRRRCPDDPTSHGIDVRQSRG